jgi:hypothetical protein
MKTYMPWILASLMIAPAVSFACNETNQNLQRQCLNQEAQERAERQREAQQEAQQRQAQQEAQQRQAQQEAQQRQAQQEAQQRQAQQREVELRAQQQAPQRADEQRQTQARTEQRSPTATVATPPPTRGTQVASVSNTYGTAVHPATQALHPTRLPEGTVTRASGGHSTLTTADHRTYEMRTNGSIAAFRSKGENATFFRNGNVRALHTSTIDIVHGVHGERVTVLRAANNRVVVEYGPHAGYLKRVFSAQGRSYSERTYVLGGQVTRRYYVPVTLRGFTFDSYLPGYYYAPAYYQWCASAWALPVDYPYPYSWRVAPWYFRANSEGYFTLDTAYVSPAAWLADYLLASAMQVSYYMQAGAQESASYDATNGPDSGEVYASTGAPINSELKEELADQVREQVSSEAAVAEHTADAASITDEQAVLRPNQLFIVDKPMQVVTDQNANCDLSPGDLLRLTLAPGGMPMAVLTVMASRSQECPALSEVQIGLEDVFEMYNTYRARLNEGMQSLAAGDPGTAMPGQPSANTQALRVPVVQSEDVPALLADAQTQGDHTEASLTAVLFAQ